MRTKSILILVSIVSLLSLGYTWPVAQEPWYIYFSEDATLEKAAIALQPYNLYEESSFRWAHTNDVTTWSGGIQYNPAQDNIVQIQSAHWKRYYSLILSNMANIEKMAHRLTSGKNTPQYQALLKEKTLLDQTIRNCWQSNSCPPVPVIKMSVHMDMANVADEIAALPIVDHIEHANPPNVFFYLFRMLSR